MADKGSARRGIAISGLIAAAIILGLVIIALASDWMGSRLSADFWPLDASRVGPNLVASVVQWALVVLVASVVYPPLRHWIEGRFSELHSKLDDHLAKATAERSELHRKLDHIIKHHPDIPDLPPKEPTP